ncbi:cytochrome P450 [Novosphingobium sp. CCH12-A3]|uniref:cytochrome P450 n=1 Tax=Novosphingobium sp. CCH12-A3 TaxID=1768752 RepID=UPI000A900BAF|nr:cytochrome P450 [Novosphingobium sp. CCH12-A3]
MLISPSEIKDRRANPRNDLISFDVSGQIDGGPLTHDELIGFMFNLFIGGLDTVSTNMGLQFWHLATHPQDQDALRADPTAIPHAIDELMRLRGGHHLSHLQERNNDPWRDDQTRR